jgi:hypothetical protein
MDEEDTDTDTEDSVDDYVPGSQSPSKGKASTQPSSSPIRRNRTSARLRQRDEGAVSEGEQLMDIDDFAPESSAAAVLSSMSARADAALLPEEQEKEDGQPKRRTYVRRDVERRKMQNAQAQKKFRLKKKKIAEDVSKIHSKLRLLLTFPDARRAQ